MLRTPVQPPTTQPAVLFGNAPWPQDKTHIAAPFDLRRDIDLVGRPANYAFFNATFPGNKGYYNDDLFLYIYHDAPPQPPPKTFAGVPILFAHPGTGISPPPSYPYPRGFWVRPGQGFIATHLKYREEDLQDWSPLFDAIREHFEHIQVPISEVIYWRCFVQIVLEDENTNRECLPSRAADLLCFYLFEKDMQRPEKPQARHRVKNPKKGQPDNTTYDVLRPGVRVSSNYIPETKNFYSTTLGTRVRNSRGRSFITIAAHGFPERCGTTVYSGLTDRGRVAGEVVDRIGNTDVALMRLADGQRFYSETFGNEKDNEPQFLHGLRIPRKYDRVYLNSPDTGYLDGHVMAFSRRKMPKDADVDVEEWVNMDWIYLGVDATQFPDSISGAVVCDDDGQVVSFFQYVFIEGPWKGWCAGTSAGELIARGYR